MYTRTLAHTHTSSSEVVYNNFDDTNVEFLQLFFPECTDTCFVNYRLCKIESEGSRAKGVDELVSSLSCAKKREDCLSKCPWWD